MRASNEHQRKRLKTGTGTLVRSVGMAEDLLQVTRRISEGQITRYKGVDYPDFMPIDVVLDAELASGDPTLTRVLASIQGYRLVAVDGGVDAPIKSRDVFALVESFMAIAKVMFEATADDHLDEGEKREIEQRLTEHSMDVQDMLARVRQGGGQ